VSTDLLLPRRDKVRFRFDITDGCITHRTWPRRVTMLQMIDMISTYALVTHLQTVYNVFTYYSMNLLNLCVDFYELYFQVMSRLRKY
jgi:hypothetical protein